LVDVHLVGSAKKLLLMDSDVLCFRDPIEVREALVCEEPCYRWCKGIRAAYCGQLDFLRNLAGASLPDELCAGFMVVPRFGVADFRKLQSLLETVRRDGRMPLDHWWTPQTFYALMAAGSSDARPLPPPYSNRLGKGDTEMKLRHYVGIKRVRHRYFTEGIPRLLTAKQSLP
jgi:hypothetical protein